MVKDEWYKFIVRRWSYHLDMLQDSLSSIDYKDFWYKTVFRLVIQTSFSHLYMIVEKIHFHLKKQRDNYPNFFT